MSYRDIKLMETFILEKCKSISRLTEHRNLSNQSQRTDSNPTNTSKFSYHRYNEAVSEQCPKHKLKDLLYPPARRTRPKKCVYSFSDEH